MVGIDREILIKLLELDVANRLEQAECSGHVRQDDYDTVQAVATQKRGIISAQASAALNSFIAS